jgi:hypothetical protein
VVALIVLILLLLLLGGGGLLAPALHILWILLVIGLILWLLGFFVRSAEGSRWYYWWRTSGSWSKGVRTAGTFFFTRTYGVY